MSNKEDQVNNSTRFETKIKPILKYVGSIGAVIMTIAYIVTVFIMVFGFQIRSLQQSVVFAVVNAIVGLIIMQLLKIQGIDFAKDLDKNKKILEEWSARQVKKARTHSIKWFWATTLVKDILIKALTVTVTTACMIYIVIQGSNDYVLLLLAVVNLLMFVCFGLLSLVSAYDFFNERHIPFLQERLDNIKNDEEKQRSIAIEEARREEAERENSIEAEVQKRLEMAKAELNKQANDMVHIDRGIDILESSDNNIPTVSDSEPMVYDNNECNHNILGGTIYSSSTTTDRIDNGVEENSYKNETEKVEEQGTC